MQPAETAEVDSPTWAPTPEAKKKSTMFRLIAAGLWVLAIAAEAFAIFWVLKQSPVNMVLLIILLVAIAGLAIGGSLLWKQANRLDPASKADTVRFFVQNQLGVIIAAIAFIPLIILIFTNKNTLQVEQERKQCGFDEPTDDATDPPTDEETEDSEG